MGGLTLLAIRQLLLEPASVRQRKLIYLFVGCVVVAAWIVHASLLPPKFPFDDAYITLHNATVLAGASEVSFAGVSPFMGSTSALHLLLVAAFAVVLPGVWALHTVMWLGVLAYLLGVARLAFVHRASCGQTVLLLLVATLLAEVPLQLLNGLETGWAMAGLVWAFALASDEPRYGRITAAIAGLLPLLRPELAVASLLILTLQSTRRWETRESNRDAIRAIGIDIGIAIAAALPFLIGLWVSTGAIVPATVSAKRSWFAEGCMYPELKRLRMVAGIEQFAGMLGVFCLSMFFLVVTQFGRASLLFIAILLFAYYRDFPGAIAHTSHRYLYVIVPTLLFGTAACLGHARVAFRISASALLIVAAIESVAYLPARWDRYLDRVGPTHDRLEAAAAFVQQTLPPTSRVLVHDAGYIAYGTTIPLIDLVGLKTPHSGEVHARITWPSCGGKRDLAIHTIAMHEKATHLVVSRGWNRLFRITSGLAKSGWKLEQLRNATDHGYDVFRIVPP